MCIDVDMGVLRSRLSLERVPLTSLFQIAPPFGKRQGEILDVGGRCLSFNKMGRG